MTIEELSNHLIAYGRKYQMQDLSIYISGLETIISFRKGHHQEVYQTISREYGQQLISRFKYLGSMDVGEKRKAQLGAITYLVNEESQRLRLSTVGDYRGQESLVIRFLHPLTTDTYTSFYPEDLPLLEQTVQQHAGLYLFSGPTGSGKTTLMYQLARQFKGQVITIEDPVEIEEPRFLQLQTNEKIQQTYDQLIKLSLRHRPDLLIIGEIRDRVTAQAAVRAALTGHTVFATVHGKSVSATKARLYDLLGETSEVDSCLNAVFYQQLLRDAKEQPKALLAYEFYVGKKEKQSWSARYQAVKEQVEIVEETDLS